MTELIVGLDVDTMPDALRIVEACGPCRFYKIGAQLFTRCGPEIVQKVMEKDKKVFLDLKYHDIPNTVLHAVKAAAAMGVSLLTIHAWGGRRMIEAARAATEGTSTQILSVTVLTSLTDAMLQQELGVPEIAAQAVPRLAKLAVESGSHGVVASPHEIGAIRQAVGMEALIVTPGVRPGWASTDDQARVMTPAEAARAGANYIVVARPVIKHQDPAEAVRLIQEELSQ